MMGAGCDAMGAYARVQIPAYAGMTVGTPGMTRPASDAEEYTLSNGTFHGYEHCLRVLRTD